MNQKRKVNQKNCRKKCERKRGQMNLCVHEYKRVLCGFLCFLFETHSFANICYEYNSNEAA